MNVWQVGGIANTFAKQARKNGYRIKRGGLAQLAILDDDRMAIFRLRMRGLLTEHQGEALRKKLLRKVLEQLEIPERGVS